MKVFSRILKKILIIGIMIIIGSLVPLSGAAPSIVRQDNAIEKPPSYLYEQLNTSQDQRLYREILDAIRLRSEKLIGVPSDEDKVFEIFISVLSDHPELFWVAPDLGFITRLRNNIPYEHQIEFTYLAASSVSRMQRQIDDKVSQILFGVSHYLHPYEKIKGVYEYLIRNTTYDEQVSDQSMYSVLVQGRGVCAGYTKAFQYVMHQLGIPSTLISGDLKEKSSIMTFNRMLNSGSISTAGHVWNTVRIDDKWYHVDVTSGESLSEVFKNPTYVSNSYLCITTDEILKTHNIDDKHRIPACSSLRYDPYRLQGTYIEHYDRETLAQLLCRTKNLGFDEIELQFSDTGLYRKVFSNLLDQGVIFKIFEEHGAVTSTVNYATDEKRCILLIGIPDNYT